MMQRAGRGIGVAAAVLGGLALPMAGQQVAGAQTAVTNGNGVIQVPSLGARWYGGAPYVLPYNAAGTSATPDTPDPVAAMKATGEKTFELAFILATDVNDPNGNEDNATNADGSAANAGDWSCAPSWDGNQPLSALVPYINAIRSAGGDVSLSFGGYGGYKLAQICGSAQATAAAMQATIDYFGIHAIDVDLEYPEYTDATYSATEVAALKILQADNPGLFVSITTATTTTGLSSNGLGVLNDAVAANFVPDSFTVMPFDGGYGFPYFNQGYRSEEGALTAVHSQLMSAYGWDPRTAWTHLGFSGMNGVTDQAQTERFTPNDFAHTVDWAESRGMSRFTFWALQRDQQCPASEMPWTASYAPWNCSGVVQAPYAFTRYGVAFSEQQMVPTDSPASPASPASAASASSTPTKTAAP